MDEEQDGFIDRQPAEKRQSRRQRRVADMRAILFRPSLHHDSEHNQRNAELREADMNLIEDRMHTRRQGDPMCTGRIHRVTCRWL